MYVCINQLKIRSIQIPPFLPKFLQFSLGFRKQKAAKVEEEKARCWVPLGLRYSNRSHWSARKSQLRLINWKRSWCPGKCLCQKPPILSCRQILQQKCIWISWGFSKRKPLVSHGFFHAIFRSVLGIKFLGTSSPSIANYNGLPAGTRALFLCVQLEEEVQQEKEALDLMVNLKEAWANRQTCLFLFASQN